MLPSVLNNWCVFLTISKYHPLVLILNTLFVYSLLLLIIICSSFSLVLVHNTFIISFYLNFCQHLSFFPLSLYLLFSLYNPYLLLLMYLFSVRCAPSFVYFFHFFSPCILFSLYISCQIASLKNWGGPSLNPNLPWGFLPNLFKCMAAFYKEIVVSLISYNLLLLVTFPYFPFI